MAHINVFGLGGLNLLYCCWW